MANTTIQSINTTNNNHTINRIDYRSERCLTIDSSGCKSHDDAVSITTTNKGWRLAVHIADVSDSVELGSELDIRVVKRSQGVFQPLFNKTLSTNTFSLLPGEDRNTMSFILYVDNEGNVYKSKITKGMIRSKIQGVYEEVDSILNADISEELAKKYGSVTYDIQEMRKIYLILRSKRTGKAVSDLECRVSSESIVEEFMILTNMEVGKYLVKNDLPALFRVASETSKASYQISSEGHSRLKLEGYSQVTSPIRRIADLKIHQILTMHLSGYTNETIHKKFDEHLAALCRKTAGKASANTAVA